MPAPRIRVNHFTAWPVQNSKRPREPSTPKTDPANKKQRGQPPPPVRARHKPVRDNTPLEDEAIRRSQAKSRAASAAAGGTGNPLSARSQYPPAAPELSWEGHLDPLDQLGPIVDIGEGDTKWKRSAKVQAGSFD